MEKTFNTENLIKLSLIALAFTPFVFINGILFPYMFGKAVFIRLMIAVAGILFAVGIISRKNPIQLRLDRLRNPLLSAYAVFLGLALVSTILSTNPYRAFWGNEERSGGLLILIYMLLFFVGTLLLFKKKDWLNFFKVNLIVGGIVAVDVLIEWIGQTDLAHSIRPDGSFLDNSAVTASYGLFVLLFACVVGILDRKKIWHYLSGGIALLTLVAIIATGTRAVMVGLAAALFVVLLRLAFVKELHARLHLFRKSISARRLSALLLLLIIAFSTIFIFTRNNPIWREAPGFNRLTEISATDPATQARLINIGISLNAVNPANVGIARSLFGWGPENYVSAHSQFYDPSIQQYETAWFDRAHNQLLDVLVMNGALGLIAYLLFWGILLRKAFSVKPKENPGQSNKEFWISLAIGGTAMAYFVQNIFFFDSIATYIPLFSLSSFGAYIYYVRNKEFQDENVETNQFSMPVKLGSASLGVLLTVSFVWTSAIPVYQMKLTTGQLREGHLDTDDVRRITTPDNFIQSELRPFLTLSALDLLPKENLADILPQMIEAGEGALAKADNRARREHEMGIIYNDAFKVLQKEEYLTRGEEHLRKALELVPERQNTAFLLAENLALQGRFDEIEAVLGVARSSELKGADISVYYFGYLAPSDFDGKLEAIEGLKKIYMGGATVEENRVISDMDILNIRESYSNHLLYAHYTNNEVLFRKFILQTIEIEKALREIIDFQVENGLIKRSVDTREATFVQALSVLDQYGLDAINLK
ncbi:O-antigen ligase family protein [Patescibacteria group bacterium]|nr:O-antigen ligase family protein [Patescibacteria group bacterium]